MRITGEREEGGYIMAGELLLIDRLPEDRQLTVIDVGANVGDFTQAVLERRPRARVVACDAQESSQRALRERFDGRRVFVGGALGAWSEQRELWASNPCDQLATFHPRTHITEVQQDSVGMIEVTTVDALCAALRVKHIDLLKLDCEGHELAVLQGAAGMLNRVDMISWEHFGDATAFRNGVTFDDYVSLLSDRFALWKMTDSGWGLVPLRHDYPAIMFAGFRR